MTLSAKIALAAALILSIAIPFGVFASGEKTRGRYKTALGINVLLFMGTLLVTGGLIFTGNAAAAETAEAAASAVNPAAGWGYLAAALSTGMSCIGGGIAVSAAASAALGAISEDGSILGKSLIFVGLAEGVCLYGLIISFMILGKL
ncbi:MAG: ATP synthase subunit C [Anaerovoracaceae bacterium]|nr:ATP synthase subunit C [Lachnospiraceae bacterium]